MAVKGCRKWMLYLLPGLDFVVDQSHSGVVVAVVAEAEAAADSVASAGKR